MTVSSEEESLAAALWVERIHGEAGPVFIAEQIGAMALQGDAPGIARWVIARAWERLQTVPVQ